MQDLSGRVVVVTGGNGGLGLGMAVGLARAGAAVAVWARNEERNRAAVETLRNEGVAAEAMRCDTAREQDVEQAMSVTLDRFGHVDSLFANAGVHSAARVVDQTLDDWQRMMRINLDGSFLCTRAAARHFTERGEGGSLVIVSSTIARYGGVGQAAYATSKTGLLGLMRTLAVELARYRVRCNALIPGWTETGMNESLRSDPRFMDATTARTPVRRWATPEEFHVIAAYLADPTLTFHTGNEVVVDGGYTVF